jgi:hypothetical protein
MLFLNIKLNSQNLTLYFLLTHCTHFLFICTYSNIILDWTMVWLLHLLICIQPLYILLFNKLHQLSCSRLQKIEMALFHLKSECLIRLLFKSNFSMNLQYCIRTRYSLNVCRIGTQTETFIQVKFHMKILETKRSLGSINHNKKQENCRLGFIESVHEE